MKKLIALLLCLVMSVSMFAACSGNGGGLVENNGEEGQKATINTEIPEDLTLTIGLPLSSTVDDYDTNAYTLWLEEVTGYDLEFITFQSNATDYKAQLSTMLATGDELPDILWNMNVGQGAYEEYGASGYFIDLAPYYQDPTVGKVFQERMAELKALDEEYHDYVMNYLTAEDGGMYAFARIEYSLIDTMEYQVYINQTWLNNLGLKMPTNKEELYDTLVAFRDKDPNGNGKKDEKPLIGGTGVVSWIINMFTHFNEKNWFNVNENNELYLPHLTDDYREALIFIRKLIDEGLMFNNVFSMGAKDIKSLLNLPEGEDMTVGVVVGHPTTIFEDGNSSVYNYEALPYWGYAVRKGQLFTPATFITQDCEYPLAAWNLLMAMTTEEGSFRQRYGEYGVDYVDADPGTKSFLGQDAKIKILDESVWGGQNNACWHSIQGTVLIQAENEACQLTEDMGKWVNHKMRIMGDCYYNYVDAEPEEGVYLPDLKVPEDVQDADSNERSNSQSLLTEARSSFCCGTGTYNNPSDDAQWAAYIAEVESLGYKTWMEHRQLLYEDQFPDRVK